MCRLFVAPLILLANIGSPAADVYPSRPVTMVVPYVAGGPNDLLARIMAPRLQAILGKPVVIENAPGASGSIGTARVARADPDGYTLCLGGWATHVVNGALLKLPYNVVTDFEPIGLVAGNPLLIVARKNMPATNLQEFIRWLKENPSKALQGTAGGGGASTLVGAFFRQISGAQFQAVPYRGLPQATQGLAAGEIDFMIDLVSNSLPHVRAGRIRAYGVTANTRLTIAPDVPTVDEAGLVGFHISQWTALWAPKGTSARVIAKLNTASVDALADTEVRKRFVELGQEIPPREMQSPGALRAYQQAEVTKWWPIIEAANIKAE